ncbi:MAG: hypothetical protein ABWZ88_19710 [Variovorax sp.]
MAATQRASSAPTEKAIEQAAHRERLRQALPDTVIRLQQRHADQIDAKDIEDYVALNWLEWHGGGLRLTITGRNIRAQLAPTPI